MFFFIVFDGIFSLPNGFHFIFYQKRKKKKNPLIAGNGI